jgi:outer membrane protein OmpU
MNNFKKVGLTALAGSLAAISAHAAEMAVSGASVLTYSKDSDKEVTGNPYGMKTNLSFTASGDVNGYTVSYMQTTADQFAGMSSARLSVDMGDLGTLAFDQGSGSGLGNIDDKTPTAAEEVWDGLGGATYKSGRVGTAGASGVFNYVKSFMGVKLDAAYRDGSGTKNSDGANSGANGNAYDFALTGTGDNFGVEGVAWGLGYGETEGSNNDVINADSGKGENEDATIFTNYTVGAAQLGVQVSRQDKGGPGARTQETLAWGAAYNINENLSVSYGERTTEYKEVGGTVSTDEKTEGFAAAYTMGSMKIAGNSNNVSNISGAQGNDKMTEIAVSFAF